FNTGQFIGLSRDANLRDFKTPRTTEVLRRGYEQLEMYGYDYYGAFNRSYRNYLRRLDEKAELEAQEQALEEAFGLQSKEVEHGIVVEGTITDEQGVPLAGVSVHIKG